jgi:hypothetical protein
MSVECNAFISFYSYRELLTFLSSLTRDLSQQELQARLTMWLEFVEDSSTHVDVDALTRRLSILISSF